MRTWNASHVPLLALFRLLLGLLCLTSLIGGTFAKESKPKISKTNFEHRLRGLFYFQNSNVVLGYDRRAGVLHRSADAGEHWTKVDGIPAGKVVSLVQHPFDAKKAYVLSGGHHHWRSDDRGETWHEFKSAASPSEWRPTLSFHAGDSNKIIFHAEACRSFFECDEVALYTTDGFATNPKLLRHGSRGCTFARSSLLFTTGHKMADADRILCIVRGTYSSRSRDYRLVISDNYFLDQVEPELEPGRTVHGLVNMATVKKFMVAAAKAHGTDEMALYVTDDTSTWHRAVFHGDHKVVEGAYTVLESTNYSIQVDVMNTKPSSAMGVLFTSNSNGTYFTRNVEHTNRNRMGLVDFEMIQGIQGITLVNVVDNWKDVERSSRAERKVHSRISFDDGRTFQDLKAGKEVLHLHSVTQLRNPGRVFSSPAPGIAMGIGNTGEHLKKYQEGSLYVSDDAGLSWRKARDGPHEYEFGDQGAVLVAIRDDGPTSEIAYSIDHGKNWHTADLGTKIRVRMLTTTPDSTSLKFLLVGTEDSKGERRPVIIGLDFEGLHERKCAKGDFEKWCARLDDKGKPDCLMGHKQFYRRRKADADCFVEGEFHDPQPEFEKCTCSDRDFECDYNFEKKGDKCVQAGPVALPAGACKDAEGTFKGSSGYRLIPGNECKRGSGAQKDDPVEHKCSDSVAPPANGKISHEVTDFSAQEFSEFYYLERTETSTGQDETVIMRTGKLQIYITHDHGKTWEEILKHEKIVAIYPHRYFNDMVYFITEGRKVFYTTDRGRRFHEFEAPSPPNAQALQILSFHPHQKDWLIWTGSKDCERSTADCHAVAYVSTDRGDQWTTLLRYVRKCQFVAAEGTRRHEKLVFCTQHEGENPKHPLQLMASDDFFKENHTMHFNDTIEFATMSEFIIVAAKAPGRDSLKVDASIDGTTFADARFPPNFEVPHQRAYTVLDSSTHAVFLHVTVNDRKGYEFGSILKSNSNGTSYVMSLNAVNRNKDGYVDFEKMQGLEGVALVNVVANVEAAQNGKEDKKLKTMITHNDGAEWAYLPPPSKDSQGKEYACKGPIEKCSLHLHGYTERSNPKNTFSSPSAVGLMMGTGNVGEHLVHSSTSDTFITRDGGITWKEVSKGRYLWEYGDQGSIIVIVPHSKPTKNLLYSLDDGEKWTEYAFSDQPMVVSDISTVPTDNSKSFLLWGQFESKDRKISTVNIDFSRLHGRQCKLDEAHPEAGDYYLWKPRHPLQNDDCLFGHVAQYHRKRPEADCFNGRQIQRLHSIAHNCSCTRRDFECDYNFERQKDGSCGLVPGLAPADHSRICAEDPNAVEYYEPTGYRRIPLSTCAGGRELERLEPQARPCQRHEEDFARRHRRGLSAAALVLVLAVPVALAAAAGWWVWRRWDGKFGRIRLGDPSARGGDSGASMVWDARRPWIKYPVMAVAVAVAVVLAVPDAVGRLWRSVRARFGGGSSSYSSVNGGLRRGRGASGGAGAGGRFTTRDSFARGRGDYDTVVDTDEGELLGDDESEEEV